MTHAVCGALAVQRWLELAVGAEKGTVPGNDDFTADLREEQP
jgi:hypothetical protein